MTGRQRVREAIDRLVTKMIEDSVCDPDAPDVDWEDARNAMLDLIGVGAEERVVVRTALFEYAERLNAAKPPGGRAAAAETALGAFELFRG